ncbi:MAG TPA: ankyrin repeat domain-containing protein, partial [bacterium]|nr:ankyrin repeat domain-containing protein [bacterium]
MKKMYILLIIIISFNLFGYYSNDKKLEFKNYLKSKNLTELENLIKANGSPDFLFDDEEISPLQYAVHIEDVNLIKLLLRYNANINFRGYEKDPLPSPVFMSIDKGNVEFFKIFAESKSFNIESQENDCTLLLAALHGKQIKIAEFLIEKGADVKKCGNKRTGCPLHLTAVLGLNGIMME